MGKPFPRVAELPRRFREKLSFTAHLLKGHLARTQKATQEAVHKGFCPDLISHLCSTNDMIAINQNQER
jgi:hypothetical protein